MRRHRAGIASGAALALALSGILVYVVTAEGYKSHEAELNDGGVWVVNGKKGWSGRLNKPIDQLDGVVPTQDGKTRLDVVQDGAAVVTVNLDASRGQAIETTRLEAQDGGSAAIPTGGQVAMGGGTLASADPDSGKVWAVRYDSQVGAPLMSVVDRQADALAEAGKGAVLAVSLDGTITTASAADDTLTTIEPAGAAFGKPATTDLPSEAGEVSQVTTVGERVVTLDAESGRLTVVGGASASVTAGSVLQQPGPDAGSVLVGTPEALLSVDLASGDTTTVASAGGIPVAPVRLGACVFGAWSGGVGSFARQCGSSEVRADTLGGDASSLAYRVNRGEIVLNDALTGTVWDVDREDARRIDNWEAFTSKKKNDDDEDENDNQTDADRRPPQAKPDSYGVRAGRTTVLHPLDNDSAPEGRLLSIVDVEQPSGDARVEISPDGQTLVLQMPEEGRDASFEYFIDDGRDGVSAHARVDVAVRGDGENEAPTQRAGYEKPTYKVPDGGSLAVPVLADWRDDSDGDTLLLDSAVAVGGEESGAQARTTPDGRIRFTAPISAEGGGSLVRVDYAVTDGRSAPVKKSISFQVQARDDQSSFAPKAEPDVVRGEVGKPIKIRPLLNDLPGSDPTSPDADLALAAKVPPQEGLKIVSDVDAGVVTVTGERAGTYFLSYDAGYGNADLDQGAIRVDVKPRPRRTAEPIAMPDTLTIYGQAPGIVDVLANDLDPAGGLLAVQNATADRPGQLDVAIVDGRWLRLSAVQPELLPATQTVSYTISNGADSGVRGEVVVTQRAAPADNTPVTVADKAIVRAGSSVSVPVLDNDVSPSGDRLTLLQDLATGGPSGQLDVVAPVDFTGDKGQAFTSGRLVRFVAPDTITERESFSVTYVAQNLDGKRAPGTVRVTVVPKDEGNDPPEPPTLESRVIGGDEVKIRVPGAGVDRNGDPVTVTGITSAPRLGRIVSYGGNFLQYQAYPRATGTDEFSYSVVDSRGAFATGTARVVVVDAGEPQRPLAVEDRLTVEPGRTATFDPLANDFVAAGDTPVVKLVDAPEGVQLDPRTNLVTVPAPDDLTEPPVTVVYTVGNGITESRSTMTLSTAKDFNNPPVVYDAFGSARESGSVVVDVLEGAYDPDGPVDGLEVSDVLGDQSARVVDEVQVRANRGAEPKVLPFVVRDSDGGTASASVYVPPTGNGLPFVVDGALVELDEGGDVTGSLGDYVSAPGDAEVRLASGRGSWSASPSPLSVDPQGDSGFRLSAAPGFRGPGALLVEVTSATDSSGNEDSTTTSDGATVLLSIPVQVGDDRPELTCPSSPIPISAGGQVDLDIASYCTVFTLDPRDAAGLDYSAEWDQSLDGLGLGAPDGSVVRVSADETATEGGEAVLTVRAGDSNTQQVRFQLDQAPPPRLSPIKVETMEAGTSRTIDVSTFLTSGVSDPSPTIVSVENVGNPAVRASSDGSRLTLTAAEDARGAQARFRLVVSDVDRSSPPASRRAEGLIQFQVIGTPSAPGAPLTFPLSDEAGTVKMGWRAPDDDGGAPILYYQVREDRSGDVQRCATNNQCVFRGVKIGARYSFQVRAANRVGEGEWSELSKSAKADTKPGRVRDITMVERGDGTITIGWKPPDTDTSKIEKYEITGGGGTVEVPGNVLSAPIGGLDNNKQYLFTVRAKNDVGWSDGRQSAAMQPLGTPPQPAAPAVTDLISGANQTSVRISWGEVSPEGPGPTVYTVTYSTGGAEVAVPGCQKTPNLTCTHSGLSYDGATYTYRVTAANVGNRSPASQGTSVSLVGRPAPWSDWSVVPTGTSQELRLTYTVPDARGSVSNVDVLVNGVARSFPNQTGQNTVTVSTPGNDTPSNVELRVCNEKAPAGCTLSGVKQAQSYGPLGDAISEIRPVVNGKNIYWVISGTANGAPVSVRYDLDGDGEQPITTQPGVSGRFSVQTKTYTTQNYNQDVRLSVAVFDPVRAGRGEDSGDNRTKSGLPPAPAVSIARGQLCGDGPDTTRPCKTSALSPACNLNSCSTIRLATEGFLENYDCTVSGAVLNPQSGNPGRQTSNHPGGGFETAWYAPGGTVTVTCTDTTGLQTGTSTVTWQPSEQ
ncbi:fibronectin type III domain-containing protein [Nocardioides sp. J2M5]|uniref:Ig-like domain-containing protein n=1 Tax=Nocardioides palaemonis TaxID=2829810 RepID=UPI001BA88966|nr:fibronectin type III domain-containing protein [Nocardioides palaemonis]MBS2939320.1 fibronectin type III domain-containing protein [Nocardioides palaemonis]